MTGPDRPIRIANCSGFYGDRMSALHEVVSGGDIDVVTGDYLAEVTMLILAKARLKDPNAGYATTFLRQLEPAINEIAQRRIKVVVNAGGLNPAGLADATRSLINEHGVTLSVAYIDGDDITPRLPQLQEAGHEIGHLHTAKPLATWGHEPLTANAYLGGFGIARALESGADIVITGRTADASLVVGAAAWWWGWQPTQYNELAGAVAAGHVIECGTQATGGNFSGFQDVPGLEEPGFPLAEIDRDGTSVITKHPHTGGAVTPDTITAQLLYEIGSTSYLNSDVTTHLDTLQLRSVGADRVAIEGAQGSPPPETTKVSITALGGWQNSTAFMLTGLNIDEKADLIERTVRHKLNKLSGIEELAFTRVGNAADDSVTQTEATCILKVSVRGDEKSAGRAFSAMLVEMALASYPGHYQFGPPGRGSSFGLYWPGIIRQDQLSHRVVHPDGTETLDSPAVVPVAETERASGPVQVDLEALSGPTSTVPLGEIVYARSGDKGGDANVGVWSSDDASWQWLRSALSVAKLRELLPETAELEVSRYELPKLYALNFYIKGLLDDGATSTTRLDKQAKALGEWLRSRAIEVPTKLLER
ncbi:uncharacterized protein DUF1446 [Antricoccus suffuscus]|uniref:Uncharacterized protein DUF1446 n=1 Tax=Antricoccus suffuscus TaxID=1629062 RepID=A0A2T1A724_9ACTN|nr:acyclic terpene utilization AtuA family protein [Antricoccus suffuscus]PRZ44128.1 uncharacterized protein DUF1446 [Antricoccus suffuscus]